jgi:hypothetical protein
MKYRTRDHRMGERTTMRTAAIGERLEDRRLFSATAFTLLPNQSVLTSTVTTLLGSLSKQGQSALNSSESSLTTHFTGTLLVSVGQGGQGTGGQGTLQFDSGSSVTAEVNGNWLPDATGNASVAAAADTAGKATVPFEGTEYVAARGLVFDASSPVINQSGGTYAVDGALQIKATAGSVAYGGVTSGTTSVVGDDATDNSGRTATLVTSGGTQTLTIPINISYSDSTSLGTVTSNYVGTIVATSPVPSASYYVKRDADAIHLDIYNNSTGTGTIADQLVYSQVSSMMLTTASAAGSITIDNSDGNAIPSGGLNLNASGNTSLLLIGSGSGDIVTQNTGQILFNSNAINYTGVTNTALDPNGGTDVLSVNAGELMLTAPTAGEGIVKRDFSSITIASGAELAQLTAANHADRALLMVGSLTIAGSVGHWTGLLDLGGNDMDLQNGSLATVTNMASAGTNFATAVFQPEGVTSSAATGDTTNLTMLGVIQNNQGGAAIYGNGTGQSAFDGTAPGASDILVKYTYFGDTNLDGKVDGSDYSRIDNGFIAKLSGWFNGDFNYDNVIDGSDYTLIDNAFNRQGASLAAAVSSQIATAPIQGNVNRLTAVCSAAYLPTPALIDASSISSAFALVPGERSRDRSIYLLNTD